MNADERQRHNDEKQRQWKHKQMLIHKARQQEGPKASLNAQSGGTGGGTPGNREVHSRGGDPWSLTREFNKSAKIAELINRPKGHKQLEALKDSMRKAANEYRKEHDISNREVKPASKIVAQELRQRLSQFRPSPEMTPMGSVTRAYDPKRDRALTAEIKRIETRLQQHQGMAKDGFNRSAGKEI